MRKPNISQMGHKKLLQTYKDWVANHREEHDVIKDMEKEILSRMPWHEQPTVKKAYSLQMEREHKRINEWYRTYCDSHQ